MNTDQLLDAMAGSDPSPGNVLYLVRRKRRAARNRTICAAASGLAVVVAIVFGALEHATSPGPQASSAAAPGGAFSGPVSRIPALTPAASGLPSEGANGISGEFGAARTPEACTQAVLAQLLARAVRSGASVIVGSAILTSDPTAGHPTGGVGATYYPVTLRSVRTLAGPTVASGAVAWITAAAAGASTGPGMAPEAVAPARELFGIVYPPAHSGLPAPVLSAAAVVRGQVILSPGGCWDTVAFPASTPHGIVATFGHSSPGRPASTEIPLAAAEKIATGS